MQIIDKHKEFSKLLLENEDLENILKLLFAEDYRVLQKEDVRFKCNCSREKFMGGIVSLGAAEIQAMIDEGKDIETVCHYCENKYVFTKEELTKLLKEIN